MRTDNPLERLATAVGAGLPRRNILKAVGAVAVAAAGGVGLKTMLDRSPGGANTARGLSQGFSDRQVTFRVEMPDGHLPQLRLMDRQIGKLSYQGKTTTVIPHMQDSTGLVELSFYDEAGTTLAKRVTIPVGTSPGDSAKVPIDEPTAIGLYASAFWASTLDEPYDLATEDCCVTCSWGFICASAACCETGNPNGGHCCDAGSCEPPICGS